MTQFCLGLIVGMLVMLLLMLLIPPVSLAYPQEVKAIVGEAAGEGYIGMVAVGEAIRNRGALRGVYGLTAKHLPLADIGTWQMAERAWEASKTSNLTNHATHWESVDFPTPAWVPDMVLTTQIGKHRFYRPKERSQSALSREKPQP